MDGDKHGRQTLGMALEMVANEILKVGYRCAMPHCDNTGDVAYSLGYNADRLGPHTWAEDWSRWIPFCQECQDDKALAPYWWNKALRGESLDDEDE